MFSSSQAACKVAPLLAGKQRVCFCHRASADLVAFKRFSCYVFCATRVLLTSVTGSAHSSAIRLANLGSRAHVTTIASRLAHTYTAPAGLLSSRPSLRSRGLVNCRGPITRDITGPLICNTLTASLRHMTSTTKPHNSSLSSSSSPSTPASAPSAPVTGATEQPASAWRRFMNQLEKLLPKRVYASPTYNRWMMVPAAVSTHLCLGSVYAWRSVCVWVVLCWRVLAYAQPAGDCQL